MMPKPEAAPFKGEKPAPCMIKGTRHSDTSATAPIKLCDSFATGYSLVRKCPTCVGQWLSVASFFLLSLDVRCVFDSCIRLFIQNIGSGDT